MLGVRRLSPQGNFFRYKILHSGASYVKNSSLKMWFISKLTSQHFCVQVWIILLLALDHILAGNHTCQRCSDSGCIDSGCICIHLSIPVDIHGCCLKVKLWMWIILGLKLPPLHQRVCHLSERDNNGVAGGSLIIYAVWRPWTCQVRWLGSWWSNGWCRYGVARMGLVKEMSLKFWQKCRFG